MDSILKYLMPCFLEVIRFPLTWCIMGVVGIAVVFIPWGLEAQKVWVLLVSAELLALFISWTIKWCLDVRTREKLIYFELQSLCPEEKDILRSMLKASVNYYELKISHDFDINAQTKQNVLVCRLTTLKDKGLLDLTQIPYDAKNDLLKATMPLMVWELLKKKYKKDPSYFVRVSNSTKRSSIKKRLKRALRKRNQR